MTARSVTLVTSNPHKAREVRAILRPFGLEVQFVRRTLAEPQAGRLEEVVHAKLAAVADLTGVVLVEDSGLFIDALGGFPGVYSAYAYETLGLARILRLLGRERRRSATFRTIVGVRRGPSRWLARGEVRGRIAGRPRGTGGFGYDPIFIPDGFRSTFAEMEPKAKDALSHRGRAFAAAGRRLTARRDR